MRRATVLILLLALGCHKSGEQKLEGHWRGTKVEGVTPEQEAAATAFATGTEMDFREGKVSVTTPSEKSSSAFKVVRAEKNTVVVITESDGSKEPQTFVFVDDDTMQWTVLEGKRMTLRREH
ncbi:hypothetical protein LZC95_53450 [Pendulispora brunnea]|uniref:Lipocalin-like domain-containing protein n=1 Tax=Pendulispora brunnea TaxID=2905690 RepID=A0ABZ2KCB2_9BACT